MISLVRVDNRLIHGQVVEAWLPVLRVARVVVGDDEAAGSSLIRAAMKLAVPNSLEVQIERLEDLPYRALSSDAAKTLMLIREVDGVLLARQLGLAMSHLNVGNVHFRTGRRQISPSVFLSSEELSALMSLGVQGVEVEIRSVPTDRPLTPTEMLERFGKGA